MDFEPGSSISPQLQLHRVRAPLCWVKSRTNKQRPDGDVKSIVSGQPGLKLQAQPRGGRYAGVSLFVPSPTFSRSVHTYLGYDSVGCAIIQPGTPLPADLGLFNDIPEFSVALNGKDQPTVSCMSHWVLYTKREMTTSEFEAAYAEVLAACHDCELEQLMQAAADIGDNFDLDDPADPFTSIAVEALDHSFADHPNPSHKLCARIFALYLRSTDLPFKDVLQHWSICNLVAGGLSAWTVADPWLWNDVLDVCKLLSEVLDEDVPRPVY